MSNIAQKIGQYFNRPTKWDRQCQPRALVRRLNEWQKRNAFPFRPLVIDIGAGSGQHIAYTVRAGNNVLALDRDEKLETLLPEVVPPGTKLPGADSVKSAAAALAFKTEKMAVFKRFDAITDPLPEQIADGVILHRIYSVLPLPGKRSLLTKIGRSLKPGGLISFLDFIIDPNPAKQLHYHLSQIMEEKRLLADHGDFSGLRNNPEVKIMAVVLKKDGSPHFINNEREIEETERLIAQGEVVIPFVGVHQSSASYLETLERSGFKIREKIEMTIPGFSGRTRVPLINIIGEANSG